MEVQLSPTLARDSGGSDPPMRLLGASVAERPCRPGRRAAAYCIGRNAAIVKRCKTASNVPESKFLNSVLPAKVLCLCLGRPQMLHHNVPRRLVRLERVRRLDRQQGGRDQHKTRRNTCAPLKILFPPQFLLAPALSTASPTICVAMDVGYDHRHQPHQRGERRARVALSGSSSQLTPAAWPNTNQTATARTTRLTPSARKGFWSPPQAQPLGHQVGGVVGACDAQNADLPAVDVAQISMSK